MMNRDIVVKI